MSENMKLKAMILAVEKSEAQKYCHSAAQKPACQTSAVNSEAELKPECAHWQLQVQVVLGAVTRLG
jgi:hypothetical protein